MKFYILVHSDEFVDAQLASLSRHHPGSQVIFVVSSNANGVFGDRVIQCPHMSTFTMVRWLVGRLPKEPATIMEWDMILTSPIDVADAVNMEPPPAVETYHPSFISFTSPDRLHPSYLISQISLPFSKDFLPVRQSWIAGGCEEQSFFRALDNGILHYHNRAAFKTKDIMSRSRVSCWNSLMNAHGLPPIRPRIATQPGLGDMVKAGLSAIGITEERVSKAIGRPCGCSKRAEALNALGRKIGIG